MPSLIEEFVGAIRRIPPQQCRDRVDHHSEFVFGCLHLGAVLPSLRFCLARAPLKFLRKLNCGLNVRWTYVLSLSSKPVRFLIPELVQVNRATAISQLLLSRGYPRSAEIRADRALDDPSGEDEEVTRCKCCIYTKVKAKGAHRGDDSAQVAK